MEAADVERQTEAAVQYLRHEVQRSPYRTLALAAAAGWVLGGGLTLRVMRLLVLNAGRAMAGNLIAAGLRGAFDGRR
jgi:hypothetical protein